ncbi:hypothetical protein BG003_002138 [Podila horticola]|nr:hypothetical protein BG003_002138 [Podila horticola]
MANSVRMAGRVLDSLQEQRQLMSRSNHAQKLSPYPAPEDIDSGSDLSALPPRTPYRMLDGPDIENIEAYVQGFYESNEHDYEIANTTLGRSTLAARRRPSSRALPCLPLTGVGLAPSSVLSSPMRSPMMARCKTSRGNSAVFPTGQSTTTPMTPSSAFSMALRSPCSTLSRFSSRVGVAPKSSMDLIKAHNHHSDPSSFADIRSHSLSTGKGGSKEEYISEDEKKAERQALYGYQGRIRRSRSKLQRLDHDVDSEIRSPNGLANTPKTMTFRNWDRELSSGSSQDQDQGGARASPQEIVSRSRSRPHPIESRLDQTEMVVRQLRMCVEDRVALEDRIRRTDRKMREYEDGARDWEAKYLEMCRGVAQAQATC